MNRPQQHILSNGLRVVLVPCEAESVAFGLFIASGSRHETAKTAGISHFIEHMLFKGTPTRRPIDITRAIEGRGGNFNACTGEESTCYFAHLPSEYLEEAVDIISDMYLNATIPADEFAREKEVVIEEIKMYADEPDCVAMENLQAALFPKHPLGRPVAGSAKSLGPLTPDDLRQYIKAHYLPTATIAVVVGAFEPEMALDVVARALGGRGGKALLRRDKSVASPLSTPAGDATLLSRRNKNISSAVLHPPTPEVVARKDVNQAQLALGYRTFGIHDERKYAATVLDAILGRGMSSRLFQEVREKRGLSYDISSRMQFFQDAGFLSITAGLDAAKGDKARATIDRELQKLVAKRVSVTELKRIKEFLVGNFRLSHEKVTSKLFFYGNTALSFDRLVMPQEQVEAIKRVTAADVQAVAAEIFRPENASVSLVLPKTMSNGRE